MEIEYLTNDNERYAYVIGHVDTGQFMAAVVEDGYELSHFEGHAWMVELPVPEDLTAEFERWFEFCNEGEEGAFAVTWASVH